MWFVFKKVAEAGLSVNKYGEDYTEVEILRGAKMRGPQDDCLKRPAEQK